MPSIFSDLIPEQPPTESGGLFSDIVREAKGAKLRGEMQAARREGDLAEMDSRVYDVAEQVAYGATPKGLSEVLGAGLHKVGEGYSSVLNAVTPKSSMPRYEAGKPALDLTFLGAHPEREGAPDAHPLVVAVLRLLEGLTTPESMLTLPLMGAPGTGGRLAQGGFALPMTQGAIDSALKVNDPNLSPQEQEVEKYNAALMAVMGVSAGAHAMAPPKTFSVAIPPSEIINVDGQRAQVAPGKLATVEAPVEPAIEAPNTVAPEPVTAPPKAKKKAVKTEVKTDPYTKMLNEDIDSWPESFNPSSEKYTTTVPGSKSIGQGIKKGVKKGKQSGSVINPLDLYGDIVAEVQKRTDKLKDYLPGFLKKEQELRGDFSLSGPRKMLDPKESGFKDFETQIESKQLRGRLENVLKSAPGELEVYKKAGLDEFLSAKTRSPRELAEWMQEKGPQVKVVDYGMQTKTDVARARFDEMTHEWFDQLRSDEREGVRAYLESDTRDLPVEEFLPHLRDNFVQRHLEEYARLHDQLKKAPRDASIKATRYYREISSSDTSEPMPSWTKSKLKTNVQRVDVVLPQKKISYEEWLKENNRSDTQHARIVWEDNIANSVSETGYGRALWHPSEFHENLPNTVGWAMLQYKTGPKGEKIAVINGIQSSWAQDVRNRKKDFEEKAIPESSPRYKKEVGELDHPLLKDYNRLVLKAAIAQAKKEGATHILISDAESAMMTERQDRLLTSYIDPTAANIAVAEKYKHVPATAKVLNQLKSGKSVEVGTRTPLANSAEHTKALDAEIAGFQVTERPSQELGMRFNYDNALPKIAEELTGVKGEKTSLGQHKNAFDDSLKSNVTRYIIRDKNGRVMAESTDLEDAQGFFENNKKDGWTFQTLEGEKPKLRENLIFKDSDGVPKSDFSGQMYPIETQPSKTFSLFEKDKFESRTPRLYSGLMFLDPNFVKDTIQGAKDLGKYIAHYYEPIATRIALFGGKTSREFSSIAMQIASDARDNYGNLAEYTDKVKKEAGKFARAGSTWIRGVDNITERAAIGRTWSAVNGGAKANVPTTAKPMVKAIKDLNRQLAKLVGRPVTNAMHAIHTPYGYDVIRRGRGPAWDALIEGTAKANKLSKKEVSRIYTQLKAELDKPFTNGRNLRQLYALMALKFKKPITHIKAFGQWHEVVSSDPFNYAEQAATRFSHQAAFVKQFPKGTKKLARFRQKLSAEMQTDFAGPEFDRTVRALQGHPIDQSLGVWAPDTIQGAAASAMGGVIMAPVKALMLTKSFVGNTAETIVPIPGLLLGVRHQMEAWMRLATSDLYAELENTGSINRALYNNSFDPKSPIRSGARIFANGVRKVFLEQALNEFQEATAAATAHVVAEKAMAGRLKPADQARLKSVARMMGFTEQEANIMVNGPKREQKRLLKSFVSTAPARLSAGNQLIADKSVLGASKIFNQLLPFHSYQMMAWNQVVQATTGLVKNIEAKKWGNAKADARTLASLVGGRTLQGAFYLFLMAYLRSQQAGLEQQKREADKNFGKFIVNSYMQSMQGPLALLGNALEASGDPKALQLWIGSQILPMGMASDVYDAGVGNGKYQGLSSTERLGLFLESKAPGVKMIKNYVALSLLSEDQREMLVAKNKYYEWRRKEMGWRTVIDLTTDAKKDSQLRNQIRDAIKAIEEGKDWKPVLAGTDLKAAAGALRNRTVLRGPDNERLTPEQEEKAKEFLGEKGFNLLKARDAAIRELARELNRAENVEDVKPLTGKFAIDQKSATQRSEEITKALSQDALEVLKMGKKEKVDLEPTFNLGRRQEGLMEAKEAQTMQDEFVKMLNTELPRLKADVEKRDALERKLMVEKIVSRIRRMAKEKVVSENKLRK